MRVSRCLFSFYSASMASAILCERNFLHPLLEHYWYVAFQISREMERALIVAMLRFLMYKRNPLLVSANHSNLEPLEINYDATNNRQSFNYYDGMDNYIWRYDLSTLYQVIPRIDTLVCDLRMDCDENFLLISFCRCASLLTSLAVPSSRMYSISCICMCAMLRLFVHVWGTAAYCCCCSVCCLI